MGHINAKTIGGAAFAALLVCAFLSRTVYSYNLAVVTAASPQNGKLSKSESVKGLAAWADVPELYAELGGKVEEVLAAEGDIVEKGQPIIRMVYDDGELTKKLAEIEISREKLRLDVENINLKINNANRKIGELKSDVYKADAASSSDIIQLEYDIVKAESDYAALQSSQATKTESDKSARGKALEKARDQLAKAEGEHEKMSALYEVGGVSLEAFEKSAEDVKTARAAVSDLELEGEEKGAETALGNQTALENASYNIENLKRKLAALQSAAAANAEKSADAVSDKEKARQKQLNDYAYDITAMSQDLKAKGLEIKNLDLQESATREALEKYAGQLELASPVGGAIIDLKAKAGQNIAPGQLLASFGVGAAFTIECKLSLDNNFVSVGDACAVENSSWSLEGTVTKLTPAEGAKLALVAISHEGVSAGETFSVTFEKESAQGYILVPNGAVNRDGEGYFLYQIKRRNGIMGKEFYADKLRVYIGDSDSECTAIEKGVTFFEPVALLSDKAFEAGETIKLKNESDFFAE